MMDLQEEKDAYLSELLAREAISQDEFDDIIFRPSVNAFKSLYLSARFIDNINWGWNSWQAAKAQAVPESRTDFEIIEQTLDLVDLIAHANRFQRDKTKPFPFESENPRNIEWWRLACQIQELLTDTDPNNCDFEEYKAMIEAQGANP